MNHICFNDVLYIKGRIGWQALSKDEYLTEGEYYLITGVDITAEHRINFPQCYYVSKERYEMDEAIQLKNGDIIVTKDGTIGKIGIIENLDKPATLNSHLFLIRNLREDILDTEYLFYILTSDYFQKFATNNTSGSNIPAFTQANIQKFEVDLPELSQQRRIASILGNIDSKIRNNNAICSDLEAMAKLLYDYWFVQFDFPDENGKPYKSSGGKMVWNEELKREIPEGWTVDSLYAIADFINGLACQNFRPINDEHKLPVIKITEMHDGITNRTEFVRDDINETHIINNGDILFSWSASLEVMLWNGGKGGLNQHIFKVVPKVKSPNYVYMQLSYYVKNFSKMAESRKTTMGHITSDHLMQSRIVIPDASILSHFQDCSASIFKDLTVINEENQKLASLRDFLLPMLMNGQVKVN